MTQEATFLASIAAAPNDVALRLVYADWLDERGDPRGELVRIEEKMHQLPVFSDRYWQLKPRRNELLAQADEDWLVAMRYRDYCYPVFAHGIPEGVKERWRLIREFTERWNGGTLGDVGGRTEEIRQVEARLGRTLPPSIREWVAFAHDLMGNPKYEEVLRDVFQMEELEGHAAVSLLLQGEGDYHWAVRHEDFVLPDPPVHGFHLDEENFLPDERNPIQSSVTAFVLEYVIAYTPAAGGSFGVLVDDSTKLIRDLAASFPVRCRLAKADLFEMDNILVSLDSSNDRTLKFLDVKVANPLPREALPSFLWNYTRNGTAFIDLLTPEN